MHQKCNRIYHLQTKGLKNFLGEGLNPFPIPISFKTPNIKMTLRLWVCPQGQLSLPPLRGRWMRTSFGWEGKGGYGSFRYNGWTRGVQVKLWDPLRTRAIPERLRGVITTRRYINPRLSLPSQQKPWLRPNYFLLTRDAKLVQVNNSRTKRSEKKMDLRLQ